jgi:hypothetical protein
MPVITPSRLAIAVLSLTLLSFLYTLGFPSPLAQPSQPIIDHYDHKNVHSAPIIPAPWIPTPISHATPHATPAAATHGDRPEEGDDHRWDDETKSSAQAGSSKPTETGIAEFEKDGGRWEDKDKLKQSEKTGEKQETSATSMSSTLPTAALSASGAANASNATAPASVPTEAVPTTIPSTKFCKDVHNAPNVMVILRTSKAEILEKLPVQMQSLLSCVPNFAIFSDHEGSIDGIPVHNALDSIGSETKRLHEEFREYQLMHADAEHKADPGKTKTLDKWKFLPMVYKAYHLKPDAKFYIFIEADTSLSWTNVLQWAGRLDYRIPYYSGAPTFINSVQLAQRGSGIMLSQGAMRRYAKSYDELYADKWEVNLRSGCCGDLALAQALGDAHVEFYSSWPLMQSEHPASLDYTHRHWCAPAISWHHTNSEALDQMWSSQKNWTAKHGWDKPYLYRDAFQSFVAPHMEAKKEKWDNLSQDTKIVAPEGRQKQLKEEERKHKQEEGANNDPRPAMKAAPFPDPPSKHPARSLFFRKDDEKDKDKEIDWDKLAEMFKDAADSAETCQKACETIEDCLQWRYKAQGDGECHLGKVLRLGSKMTEKDEPWTSGWLVDRVEKVTKEWECKEVKWRFYQ